MAFLTCECGEQIKLTQQAGPIVCHGCGRRFTSPIIEEDTNVSEHSTPVYSDPNGTPLSSTMLQDLPMVTQFQESLGHSIVSMAPSGAAILAPMINLAVGSPESGNFDSGNDQAITPTAGETESKSPSKIDTRPITNMPTALSPGLRLLDRYVIQRKIGQGGMSTVYEAFDEVRGEKVALKVLLPSLANQPQLQDLFLQEGRLSSNFSHANIARVYDLHQTDSMVFLSMELLQGSTLRHDMNRRKNQRQVYRPTEVLGILQHICEALEVVHAAGVIHRDLKPENLWLDLDESVKIMDFGIARSSTTKAYTAAGRGSGTPYYIAPEQLAASPTMDARADQYSVAIIMYELLTGDLPQGVISKPHEKNRDIPKKMSQAIFQALDSDPANRFATIQELCEAAQFRTEKTLMEKIVVPFAVMLLLAVLGGGFARWGAPLLQKEESPVWEPLGQQKTVEGSELRFSVRNSRRTIDAKQLNFKLMADAPLGASLDANTGEFLWTPTEAQGPQDYSFTIMAVVDEEGGASVVSERSFSIAVSEYKHLPIFDTPELASGKEHEKFEFSIGAIDSNLPGIGLRYELLDPPAGLLINQQSGIVSWEPNELQGGKTFRVPVRVYLQGDENLDLFTERMLSVQIEESIDPPILSAPNQLEGTVGKPVRLRVTARDANTPKINTYFQLKDGDRLGMTIEPDTGEISWTPTSDQAGKELEVNVQVRQDRAGKSEVLSEQTIKLLVDAIDEVATNGRSDQGGNTLPSTTTSTTGGTNEGEVGNAGGGSGEVCQAPSSGTGQTDGGGNNDHPDGNHEQSKPDMGPYGGYYPSTSTGKWGTADSKQGQSKPGKNQQGNHGNKRPGNKIGQVIDMVELFKQKKKAGKQQAPIGTSRHRDWPYNSSKKKTTSKKKPSRSSGIRLEDLLSSKKKKNQARTADSRLRKSGKKTKPAAPKNNQSQPRKSKVQTFSPNSNNLKRTSPSLQRVLGLQNKSEQ
jgi:serine/threonine protein kinase